MHKKNQVFPLGIDSFEELRATGCYYVDKTKFIQEFLNDRFKINLITRPRRFGKTLTMSMMADFFDIRKDSREIFEDTEIMKHKEICSEWMNKWPVLSVTFKDVEDLSFAEAYAQLVFTISGLCLEHDYLLDSRRVKESDKELLNQLIAQDAKKTTVKNSLFILTRMMKAHYGKPVILLVDEYDVPLAKANEHGHYQQMLNTVRGVLSTALKTNRNLQFAVVTGCLRIAKESIFTGTNHFVSNSILADSYTDVFGFTKKEVEQMLMDTGLEDHAEDIQRCYDGYRICKAEIYCPWDVLNYVKDLCKNPDIPPKSYWKDTSHNDIIRSFIGQEDFNITDKLESLLAGGHVKVQVCDDLSYDLVHSSEENFWSILYLTGYLTSARPEDISSAEIISPGESCLKIPNEEIKEIFADTVAVWP